MCQSIIIGIISGIVTAIIIWSISVLWNYKACRIVRIQARRMQCYLSSINNDITWGVEDGENDYYDNMMLKIPFIIQSTDIARESLSLLNFRLHNRRIYIDKQLSEIATGMEILLNDAIGADPELEKDERLKSAKDKYQTSCNNILYYRAVFLEKLTKLSSVQRILEEMEYDEDIDEMQKIYSILKNI